MIEDDSDDKSNECPKHPQTRNDNRSLSAPASTGRHWIVTFIFPHTSLQEDSIEMSEMSLNLLISADESKDAVEGNTMANAEEASSSQEPIAEQGDGDGRSTGTEPMSKKALKKAAKAERIAATKLERRAREKEAKKVKKRIIAEKRAAGQLNEEDDEETRRRAKRPKIDFAGKVVVDLGFDELMSDKVS